jgi:hypothetical protein
MSSADSAETKDTEAKDKEKDSGQTMSSADSAETKDTEAKDKEKDSGKSKGSDRSKGKSKQSRGKK